MGRDRLTQVPGLFRSAPVARYPTRRSLCVQSASVRPVWGRFCRSRCSSLQGRSGGRMPVPRVWLAGFGGLPASAEEPTPGATPSQLFPAGPGPTSAPGPNAGPAPVPTTVPAEVANWDGLAGAAQLGALGVASLLLAGVAFTTLAWMLHAWRTPQHLKAPASSVRAARRACRSRCWCRPGTRRRCWGRLSTSWPV